MYNPYTSFSFWFVPALLILTAIGYMFKTELLILVLLPILYCVGVWVGNKEIEWRNKK